MTMNSVRVYNRGMGIIGWVGNNLFAVVLSGGVLAAITFTGVGFFFDAQARRVSNLIALTDRHRVLWERMYSDPKLVRILDPAADTGRAPVTPEEKMFVVFLILHLANTFYTTKTWFLKRPQGLRKDVERFFSLPVPQKVWQMVRELQDEEFVRFVDLCTSGRTSCRERS